MAGSYNLDDDPYDPYDSYDSYAYDYEDDRGDNFSRHVWLALIIAIVLHVVVLFFLGKIPFVVDLQDSWEWTSQDVSVDDQVVIMPNGVDEPIIDNAEEVAPPEDAADLLANIDEILPEIRNTDIDISPHIAEPEINLKMERPALSGEGLDDLLEPTKGPDLAMEMEDIGSQEIFKDAAAGQVVIEEGASLSDVLDPDEFNDSLLKKGAGGLSDSGVMEGFSRLDDMLAMPEGKLTRSKAMIGSDLLFEFGSSTLRESARLSLMKVAMLIELNPNMFCWLEGHTDLIGSEAYNRSLSEKRAAAVRDYLVAAFDIDHSRLFVQAYGMTQPIILEGLQEEQAVNRRVEIKMRKERPVELAEPVTRKAVIIADPDGNSPSAPAVEPAAQPAAQPTQSATPADQAIPYDPNQDPRKVAEPALPVEAAEPLIPAPIHPLPIEQAEPVELDQALPVR